MGSAVLTFIGFKQTNKQTDKQTDRQAKFIDYILKYSSLIKKYKATFFYLPFVGPNNTISDERNFIFHLPHLKFTFSQPS